MRRRVPLILFLIAALALSSVAVSSAVSGPAQFNPDPVGVGSVQAGQQGSKTVTITNGGDTDMTISAGAFSFSGSNPAAFGTANDTCSGQVIASGANCTVDVTFSPNSAGDYSATMSMASDAATSGQVAVSGTATPAPAPAISVSPSSPFDFGNQKVNTSSGPQQFTVTNTGNATLHVTTATVAGGGFSEGANNCDGAALGTSPADDSCTVSATFQPGSAGPATGSLSISSSELAPAVVELDGTGTVPIASVPSSVSFSTPLNVGQTLPVTLTNTGKAQLNVQDVAISGDPEFTKTGGGDCANAQLAAGASCNAQIQFLPTAGGAHNATVTFTDDDNANPGSTQQVSLVGTVNVPGISASPSTLAFGNLVVGHLSTAQPVTITNTGNANLRIDAVNINGLNPSAFVLGSESCTGGLVAPGNSCSASIRFAPAKSTSRVANLVFVNNAGPDQSVALTGQGSRPPGAGALRAASGCSDAFLSWQNPSEGFFKKMLVVRNRRRFPRNAEDGVIVPHSGPSLLDTAPVQFRTYRYALFARYGSYNGEKVFYSAGVRAKVHTGRICTPRNNGLTGDLTPTVDWTSYTGARYYAFILQHSGSTIWVHYVKKSRFQIPSSWTFNHSTHALGHGGTYTFYLYGYTRARPSGVGIGHTTWTEK